MTLDASVFHGALPDIDVTVGRESAPPKQSRPRKRWDTTAIAKRIGIERTALHKYLTNDADLRRILRWDEVSRHRDHIGEAEVREAGEHILSLPYWSWSRAGHRCCLECGTTEKQHRGHGLCVDCGNRASWRRTGHGSFVDRHAWSKSTGKARCAVCLRSKVKHYAKGHCAACLQWARRCGLFEMPKAERWRFVRARREALKQGANRGRCTLPEDKRRKRGPRPGEVE